MPMMMDEHMTSLGGGMAAMDDDLFGDVGDEVLAMPPRPPSKQLQQRVDEMRLRGCCRRIAYSKHGSIASISADGSQVSLQCPRTNPSNGSWELGEPMSCSLPATLPDGPIVHLAWAPTQQSELAVMDAFGRVCMLNLPVHLNKATYTPRKWDGDALDDLQSIVGCYWLPTQVPRMLNIIYGPAVRENDKYTYASNVNQAFGPWHPNAQKSSLVCVTSGGVLKLFFYQNSNQVQDIHVEMESITSSDDLITHAAISSERGKLLIVLATAAKQLKFVLAEINWGFPQPNDKQIPPGSVPLRPSLKVEHVATTSWFQPGWVDSHLDASMSQLSNLEVLPPIIDMRTKTTTPAMVLAVRVHLPNVESHYNMEYQSIIDRWEVITDQAQKLHPAFEQRGSRAGAASSPSPLTEVRKRDSIVINKVIVSIESTLHGRLICIGFSDGTVQYRDRITMEELHHEGQQNQIQILQQAGFHYGEEKPSLQTAFSPNNCSFAQICEDGSVRWNSLQYPMAQIGATRTDPLYDAVLSSLTMALANSTYQTTNYDDILAVTRPFVEKHPRFLNDLVSTLVFMLGVNVDCSEESSDNLVRNMHLLFVMSILNHFGFRGDFKPRSFNGRSAMLSLNVRHVIILVTLASNTPNSPNSPIKISPLDEPEVVNALCGCAKWAIDLLCWMTDSLFNLRDDHKFMELIQDTRSFAEMTNYLKSKDQGALHLLLCSSTRCFLSVICRRLTHLQRICNQAMQFWETRPPSNSADPAALASRSLHQAYLKLHRCTTTNLIKVEEFEKLLNHVSAEVRQAYQASLAGLQQRQQQQQQQQQLGQPSKPGQPNTTDQTIKKAQAHCELLILLGDQPPSNSFQPLVKKFFELDLGNLMAATDRSLLFFTEFPLLEIEDSPKRLAARKAEGLYIDVFRRVELKAPWLVKGKANGVDSAHQHPVQDQELEASGSGHPAFRRCLRCCGVMEDVVATRPGYNFVMAQQRKCACGGSWVSLS